LDEAGHRGHEAAPRDAGRHAERRAVDHAPAPLKFEHCTKDSEVIVHGENI
jgi:hypothetical protein